MELSKNSKIAVIAMPRMGVRPIVTLLHHYMQKKFGFEPPMLQTWFNCYHKNWSSEQGLNYDRDKFLKKFEYLQSDPVNRIFQMQPYRPVPGFAYGNFRYKYVWDYMVNNYKFVFVERRDMWETLLILLCHKRLDRSGDYWPIADNWKLLTKRDGAKPAHVFKSAFLSESAQFKVNFYYKLKQQVEDAGNLLATIDPMTYMKFEDPREIIAPITGPDWPFYMDPLDKIIAPVMRHIEPKVINEMGVIKDDSNTYYAVENIGPWNPYTTDRKGNKKLRLPRALRNFHREFYDYRVSELKQWVNSDDCFIRTDGTGAVTKKQLSDGRKRSISASRETLPRQHVVVDEDTKVS